jgi:hypothetical protein
VRACGRSGSTPRAPPAACRAQLKVEAISSRGARKDFVDLYCICQEPGWSVAKALGSYSARFASANPDVGHRVKALTYFDDAEREPELLMIAPILWSDVRAFFEKEVEAWWRLSLSR